MIKSNNIIILLLCLLSANSYAGGLWPELDINDTKLPKESVMRQCYKSLFYAPEQLEAWCDKAYELGYWQALEYIGLHTGDGSRYISELNSRAELGKLDAIFYLAKNYSDGRFVSRNIDKSISLYNQYLNNKTSEEKHLLNSVHKELYLIYKELGNIEKTVEHKKYLEEHDDTKAKNEM
ncbi:hypothetical protein ACPUVO_13935 [Pseudocolwellia sp. HL-MZ19]